MRTSKHFATTLAAISLAAVFWVMPISIQPSPTSAVTISVDQAQAYTYGRHRRIYRRTYRHYRRVYRRVYRRNYYYRHGYRYYY
jgi:hypothetical protein